MNKMKFKYNVDESPESKKEHIALSLQHVFAMFGSTILVPTLIGIDVATALLTAGFGTLIYTTVTKKKVPVFIGSSFVYIGILSMYNQLYGASGVGIAVMSVGLMYLIIAGIISLTGVNWIDRILPPIVVGPLIITIGLSLAPVAIQNSGFSAANPDINSVIIALTSILCTVFALLKGNKVLKMLPIIFGILGGYLMGVFLGVVDVSTIFADGIFSIPTLNIPFISYNPEIDFNIVSNSVDASQKTISVAEVLGLLPLVLVTISEHIGDHTVSSSLIGKNFLKDPGLKRTILGDGLATFWAGFLGGPVNTTYAENTGVIMLTKIASVSVIRLAAVFSITLSFITPLINFINSIPPAVMGGISIILFGMIAQNGIRVLMESKIDFTHSRNMIIGAIILVFGVGNAVLTIGFTFSGMSLAALIGIIFHLILPEKEVAYGEKGLKKE